MSTAPGGGPEVPPEVKQLQAPGSQPTLEDLIKVAGPIATAYFESQERITKRASEVEEKAIASTEKQHGRTLAVVTALSLGIMILAGLLVMRDRDQSAKDLIQLAVSLAAAGFGGYGVGRLKERSDTAEE